MRGTGVLIRRGADTPPAPSGEPKSESVALGLSLGGTLASWGLYVGGLALLVHTDDDRYITMTMTVMGGLGTLIAPSLGNGYAGTMLTRGLGMRAGWF